MQPQVQLVITLNPANGAISVTGPIDNKILSYGMLEIARDVIKDHQPGPTNGLVIAKEGDLG